MEEQQIQSSKNKSMYIIAIAAIILLLGAAASLYIMVTKANLAAEEADAALAAATARTSTEQESLITYTIPNQWTEKLCERYPDMRYIVPADDTSFNCDSGRTAPIIIAKDSTGITNCDQITKQPNAVEQNCTATKVNGLDAVVTKITYGKSTELPENTTVQVYFIATNKGVTALTHTDPGTKSYAAEFQKLVDSTKINTQ